MCKDNDSSLGNRNGVSLVDTLHVVMCTFFGVIPVGLFYGWAVLSEPIGIIYYT